MTNENKSALLRDAQNLSPSDDLIAFAITETFGERCKDRDADCYTCQAWDQYDKARAALQSQPSAPQPSPDHSDKIEARRSQLAAPYSTGLDIEILNKNGEVTWLLSGIARRKTDLGLRPDEFRKLCRDTENKLSAMLSAAPPAPAGTEWRDITSAPPVPVGHEKEFVLAVYRKHRGKAYTFAASYLNAYPLDYRDGCPNKDSCNDEGCEDGCPTTGWFTTTGDDDYDFLYSRLSLEPGDAILGWQEIPQWNGPLPPPPASGDAAMKRPDDTTQ